MKKFEFVSFHLVSEDLEDYLKSQGYSEVEYGIWTDILNRKEIRIKNGEISCHNNELSFVHDDGKLDLFLSYIPSTPILNILLKEIGYV
jgi:hypothetical protein